MPTFDIARHLQHLLYSSSWTLYVGVSNPTVCQELTHIARKMKLWKHLFFRYLDYIFMNLLVVYERFMHKDEPRIVNCVAHCCCFCKRPACLRAEYGVICLRIAASKYRSSIFVFCLVREALCRDKFYRLARPWNVLSAESLATCPELSRLVSKINLRASPRLTASSLSLCSLVSTVFCYFIADTCQFESVSWFVVLWRGPNHKNVCVRFLDFTDNEWLGFVLKS